MAAIKLSSLDMIHGFVSKCEELASENEKISSKFNKAVKNMRSTLKKFDNSAKAFLDSESLDNGEYKNSEIYKDKCEFGKAFLAFSQLNTSKYKDRDQKSLDYRKKEVIETAKSSIQKYHKDYENSPLHIKYV